MLTFTEFFTKKKIDIIALQKSRPDLYQEFDRDYALMGEKSFDHSKKFWFNRLRKEYLLEEIEIPAEEKKEVVLEKKIEAVNSLDTSAVKGKIKSSEVTDSGNPAAKPAGFKPRFKATSIKKPVEIETPKKEEEKPPVAAEKSTEEERKPIKPAGFKPRFKASNLPKPAVTETPKIEESTDSLKPEAPIAEVSPAEEPAVEEKKAVKPAGFKPRFKASNLPKKLEDKPEEGKTNKTEDKKDKEDDN